MGSGGLPKTALGLSEPVVLAVGNFGDSTVGERHLLNLLGF